ncbi:MAG: glycosyltransferase [Alistipes sp.]|nr:glycosyltransferase [Alistipes sp.]
MNILFYMPLPEYGGVRTITERLASELKSRGNTVFLLMHRRFYNDTRDYSPIIESYFLPSETLMDDNNIKFYHSLVESLKIDIIINQDGLYEGVKLIDTIRHRGVPVISVIHNDPIGCGRWIFRDAITLRNDSFIEKLKRLARIVLYPRTKKRYIDSIKGQFDLLYKGESHICVLSPRFIDDIKLINPKIKDISAIPNFNIYKETNKCLKEKIVLYVGRLDNRQKKVQYLLDIWKSVSKQVPDWKLVIVGEGKDGASLKAKAAKIRNVEFCGYQDPTSYYERASILCMTSIFEGFPMVLTETMQHGCVPIAFDSFAAIYDIITPGIDGEIVKAFDKREYVNKLIHLIKCEDYRNELATAAKRNVKRYDLENIIEQWDALFRYVKS